VVLPITLLSFNALVENQKVVTRWNTASEINNDYFTVERTTDGLNYEIVAKVQGAGNSTELHTYVALDENPPQGRSYYRLRQTDYDGTTVTFPQKSIFLNDVRLKAFIRQDQLNVSFYSPSISDLSVELFQVSGNRIFSKAESLKEGENTFSYPLHELSQGLYILKIESGDQQVVQKLVN
jgi:hypothetical protein